MNSYLDLYKSIRPNKPIQRDTEHDKLIAAIHTTIIRLEALSEDAIRANAFLLLDEYNAILFMLYPLVKK